MKHTEIPNAISEQKVSLYDDENPKRILETGDKVIYASIRRYMNNETRECFPSIHRIKDKAKCGQAKINAAIDRLIKAGFIKLEKKKVATGRTSNVYYFPKSKFDENFEMFTDAFLDLDIPINIKEYYMDIQGFLYDKESGVGKCSFSNAELAKRLGISVPSVKKYNKYLIEHNLLEEETTQTTDKAGLPVVLKNFNLTGLQQAELWARAITQQTIDNTEQLKQHNEEIESLKSKIAELEKEMSLKRNKTLNSQEYPL